MFTLKITYRGQTRRHTFSDTNTFPSYDDISTQLHRSFSISDNFYYSKLLFSPDAAQPSRILIGKEVHNAYEYNKCIRQFKNRSWPHALLRFTVVDFHSREAIALPTNIVTTRFTPVGPQLAFSSASPNESQAAMDVDPAPAPPTTRSVSMRFIRPQATRPAAQRRASDGACCSITNANEDMRAILTEFKDLVDSALATNLSMMTNGSNSANDAPPPSLCSVCTRNIGALHNGHGDWYSCESCHVVVCEACHNEARPGFCLSNMGLHNMKLASASDARGSNLPIPHLPTPWDRFMTEPSGPSSTPASSTSTATAQAPIAASNPTPVVHLGIVCDVCNEIVEGVRHKCLDCPDYDLCDSCICQGAAEAHNPFHEFFDILEPGRVIVHNVFTGDGERETTRRSQRGSAAPPPAPEPVAPSSPAVHPATCNLCDSRIIGDRYKCLRCPDFDSCSTCFSITPDQHPQHAFARLQTPEDYVRARTSNNPMHYATCNGCNRTIYGCRFKCMQPECPDYDLCESCEALPIPVHPALHPMLKMRLPETVIPTVYRVGVRQIIPQSIPSVRQQVTMAVAESPVPKPTVARKPPAPASPQPLVNPFVQDEERAKTPTPPTTTFFKPASPVKAPSPVKPPPVPPKPEMISHASWASIPGFFGSSAHWEPESVHPYERYPPVSDNLGDIFQPKPSLGNPFADIPLLNVSTLSAAPSFGPVPQTTPNLPPVASSEITLPTVPSHTPMNPWPTTNAAERQELLQLIANVSGSKGSPVVVAEQSAKPVTPPAERLVDVHESIASTPEPSSKQNGAKALSPGDFTDLSLSHLLRDLEERVASLKANSDVGEDKLTSATGSSLSEEALLKRPSSEPSASDSTLSYRPSLAHLIAELPSLVPKAAEAVPEATANAKETPRGVVSLSASFLEDVTVPDGQIFPPGAEFVKCWRLLNDSTRDWPESTQLVFVAGESLSNEKGELAVELGKVEAGKEIDVWTGELKAPDGPGRYVGYWRLKADGELFGNSLWIEINVVEADVHHSSDESSMAASSVIMPQVSAAQDGASRPALSSTVQSAAGDTSTISTEDDISDAGSDISLISMPSSPSDDEDEGLFHDSRSYVTAELAATTVASSSRTARSAYTSNHTSAMDYVLLYDDTSSSED